MNTQFERKKKETVKMRPSILLDPGFQLKKMMLSPSLGGLFELSTALKF